MLVALILKMFRRLKKIMITGNKTK